MKLQCNPAVQCMCIVRYHLVSYRTFQLLGSVNSNAMVPLEMPVGKFVRKRTVGVSCCATYRHVTVTCFGSGIDPISLLLTAPGTNTPTGGSYLKPATLFTQSSFVLLFRNSILPSKPA